MRIGDAHILASEHAQAVGRYMTDGRTQFICWMSLETGLMETTTASTAIEITTPQKLSSRLPLETRSSEVFWGSLGTIVPNLGIALATNNGYVEFGSFALGHCDIEKLRKVIGKGPSAVAKVIGDQ